MRYHALLPLFAAVANLVLGLVVARRTGQDRLGRVFGFTATILALWNLQFFILYSVADHDTAFLLVRPIRAGALLLPAAILHITCVLGDRRSETRLILLLSYAIACLFVVGNAFDLVVADLRPFSWGYYSVGGPLYGLYTIFLIANFIGVTVALVYYYRTATDPRMLLQLRFWSLGAAVALPLGLTNFLPAYGIPFYPLGSIGNAAWAGIVAYAIMQHRLMDVDVAITKGVAYTLVAFLLIAPAFGFTLWLQEQSFGQIHPDFSFFILLLMIGVGALFPSLRMRAESQIERSFFREKHAYRVALRAFTRSIVRILDRDKLIRDLTTTLSDALGLQRMAIALIDEPRRVFNVRSSVGAVPLDVEFPETHELAAWLVRRQQSVLRDEVEESTDPVERTLIAEVYRRNGWEVCIPLTVGSRLIGFIALGRKSNRDTFSSADLELLETLGAEASIALENARLYEELKKSQEIIRRADRLSALGTLAAGIAHEVRNPLVSIQTFFQLAPTRRHDDEFFDSFLPMAASEVTRISSLITELLSFARSPARSLTSVDLNETVERVVTLLEPEARKSKLTIERRLSPTVPLARADADQIKQVLINLVLNAIQACEQGGMVTISTQAIHHQGILCGRIEIRDTGVGIAKDKLEHIFVPFFTTKDKGTGLGLAIAHQIITEHGGFISVESEQGKGTQFLVDLPAEDGAGFIEALDEPMNPEQLALTSPGPRRVAG